MSEEDQGMEDSLSCEVSDEAAVAAACTRLPDEVALCDLAEFFKVMTDATRLKMVYALTGGELCVCDLASVTGASVSSVSHHLSALKRARVVRPRREGRAIFYSLDDFHVQKILGFAQEHLGE